MVLERKSAVLAKNTWFWRNSPLLNRRRSRSLDKKIQSSSRLAREATALKSPVTQDSWLNFSVFGRNNTAIRERRKKPIAYTQEQSSTSLHDISDTGTIPVWLLRLYKVNRYSSVLAFVLVVAALIVYGWTVYSQELWSQSYRKFKNLQRHERQLNTANATLTSKMAQEAEKPDTELVSPTSEKTIFLPPKFSNYPQSSLSTSQPDPQPEPPSPLGY
ncbi:hypothetical protein H6F39_02945 [Anabaena sp. FACHB-1250]|uniref:Cell division protein FtsL n=1 Tax=Dolichospermum planctonicum TaxID=136072 RepID=A0A480AHR6_9CYAN|nr:MULTISPECIES: hypothetical protein [Nostocales]MBD2140360.1 hypothetical protein [Anabaena sp. FACHB-1250]MBD2269272.1 hypothetical protein [Anabaena sp. FACHB-1391]GCL42818.1 hypothetical protein NIES80_25260 [Dolichospermum planctonicum]